MRKWILFAGIGILIVFPVWQLGDIPGLFGLWAAGVLLYFALAVLRPWARQRKTDKPLDSPQFPKRVSAILFASWVLAVVAFTGLNRMVEPPPPELLAGHAGEISALAFSPKADRLVSGGMDRGARVWDRKGAKFELLRELPKAEQPIYSAYPYAFTTVAYSPDGSLIAAGSADWTIRVWRVQDRSLVYQLAGHTQPIKTITFSPDGRFLASGGDDKVMRLWRMEDGSLAYFVEQGEPVTALAYSFDGKTLAVASGAKGIFLYQVGTNYALQAAFPGYGDPVIALWFAPDNSELLSLTDKRTLRRWKLADGSFREMYRERREQIFSAAFSRDGTRFVTGDPDKAVRLWTTIEITTTAPTPTITPNIPVLPTPPYPPKLEMAQRPDVATAIAFDPSGIYLATGNRDNKVRVWNATTGALLKTLDAHGDYVTGVAFSPDGKFIISASADKTVRLWHWEDARIIVTFDGTTNGVVGLSFNRDATNLAVANLDGQIRTWGVKDGNLVAEHTWKPQPITSLALNPADGTTVAAGNLQGRVRLFPALGTLPTFEAYKSEVSALAFRPDGKALATGGIDQPVRLWNLSGQRMHELPGVKGRITNLVFAPDGKLLAAASWNKTVTVWRFENLDAITRTTPINLAHVTSVVTALAFSADGQTLVAGGLDGAVTVWRMEDGGWLETWEGDAQPIMGVAVRADDAILVAASAGNPPAVQVWTAGNVREIRNPLSRYHLEKFFLGQPAARFFWSAVIGFGVAASLVLAFVLLVSISAAQSMRAEFPDASPTQLWRWVWDVELGIHKAQLLVANGECKSLRAPAGNLARLGGPGMLVVEEGNAVALSKSGQFSRVVGAGIAWLRPFERVSTIVYLSPRVETLVVEKLVTQDRLPLTQFALTFFHRVDPGDQSAVSGTQRYDPKLIHDKVWSPHGGDWRGAVRAIAESVVRDLIAQYNMAELVAIAGEARQNLAAELRARINVKTQQFLGVEIVSTDIGAIVIPPDIQSALTEQALAQVHRQTLVIQAEAEKEKIVREAEGAAFRTRLIEHERDALRKALIHELAEPLRDANGEPLVSEETAERYVGVLTRFLDLIESSLGPDELDRLLALRGRKP